MQWEVEALEPVELRRLVLAAVAPYVDCTVLVWQIAQEEQQRRALDEFIGGWGAGSVIGSAGAGAISTWPWPRASDDFRPVRRVGQGCCPVGVVQRVAQRWC